MSTQLADRHSKRRPYNSGLSVTIRTFGFTYPEGMPEVPSAALVLDLRTLLRNPPDDNPTLLEMTGLDEPVRQHVANTDGAEDIICDTVGKIKALASGWAMGWFDGDDIVILIGCKYGHHRSVAIGEIIKEILTHLGYTCAIDHRDYMKPMR
ncbi:RNase adapter RapZ [Actinoallomurus sp. NPDC050550]|uniref:RapZ C-terminal domain-containing protein n=1 Tax=Actinoallomurus sp. NPDC050550 TaxID=3154937 RepID=UPI0033DCE33C